MNPLGLSRNGSTLNMRWRLHPVMRMSRMVLHLPSSRVASDLHSLSRSMSSRVIGLIMGHGHLKKHLHRVDILREDPLCRMCDEQEKTAEHIPESTLFMTPTTTSAEETDSETHIPTTAETPVITAAEKTMNIKTNSSEKTSVKTAWNTLTETNMATAAEKITTAGSKTLPTTAAEKRMAKMNLNSSSLFQSSQVSPSGEKKPPHTSTKLKDGETYQDFSKRNIDKARKLRNEILTASTQTITLETRLDGYVLMESFSRENHLKGGTAIYVREDLAGSTSNLNIADWSTELICEVAGIKITIDKTDYHIIGVYGPEGDFTTRVKKLYCH
ncbi:hypothetical protein J6590_047604 [Homalodisca vitripennis]|nr:hypothetical protein J6590_047604 [Homalodisca vitripennis]